MFTSEENEENEDGSGVAGVVIDKHVVVDDEYEDRDYDELWRAMMTTTLTMMMMTKARKRKIINEMLYFFLETVKKGKQNRLITVVGYSCFTVFKYYE